jgi:hypothetical protein
MMKILRADSIDDAVRYARQCQAEGEFDLFRGQVRRRPLVPTLLRLDPESAQQAATRMEMFLHWVENTSLAHRMLPDLPSCVAVAQHYGLPTRLLDVTRDPRIAGFFASHTASPPEGAVDSCIFCFNSGRVKRAMAKLRADAIAAGFEEDDVELPFLLDIDVQNLWRLQAQRGAFLVVPLSLENPEELLIERMLDVTCVVFPYSGPLAGVEQRWVYPNRKSALEVLLDEFFEREALAEHQAEMRAAGVTVIDAAKAQEMAASIDFAALGFRKEVVDVLKLQDRGAECFRGGEVPPADESWLDPEVVGPWVNVDAETFHDAYSEQEFVLRAGKAPNLDALEVACVARVRKALAAGKVPRNRTVHWRLISGAGAEVAAPTLDDELPNPERATAGRWIELAWDGMRALPYSDEELSIAIGRIAAGLAWIGRGKSPWGGDFLAIDLVTETGGDPMTRLPQAAFRESLRLDLWLLLDPAWQHLIDDPKLLVMAVPSPQLLFDFDSWRRLFAAYLIPSQVLMCAQGGSHWVIYNPVLLKGFRLH